ncbi:UNVERIFIED_CONTAM: protein NRT1/ PTR FAMILY 5.4 [Sesamum calycinum]|uniref:Protein NRT1/ PTR FAMILY 5.4 n=1 Tax=Sesamum calycinum TaxID=2727403 RepID=A0AAW2R670_9LAMI
MPGNSPLKNTSRGGWKSAIFIIFVEVAERFAYYGVAGNLMMYLTRVLGQPTATAAKNVNIWQGVSAVFPVVGGFLADSYIGRFRTILLASTIYLIVRPGSADSSGLRSSSACSGYSFLHSPLCSGRRRRRAQAMRADFRCGSIRRGLPEEKTAKSSFFNWWYVGIVCGATAAVLVVIYVEDYVGWKFGFGMLVVAVAVALVVFLIGSGSYRRQAPVGSPFTRVAQVMVAAVRKRRLAEGRGVGFVLKRMVGQFTLCLVLASSGC